MSDDIGSRGMHIFKICDGTCREPVYAVLSGRNRRPSHSPLFSSTYGEPLILSGVMVRRHPKHHAWNLIISADTRIERISTRTTTSPDEGSSGETTISEDSFFDDDQEQNIHDGLKKSSLYMNKNQINKNHVSSQKNTSSGKTRVFPSSKKRSGQGR
jgi:hypothetical protein